MDDDQLAGDRQLGFWTKPRPLGQRILALACFVVPVSAAITYALGGTGVLVADLIACAVIIPAIGIVASRGSGR